MDNIQLLNTENKIDTLKSQNPISNYQKTQDNKNQTIWDRLREINVDQAILMFLNTLKDGTKLNYGNSFKKLSERGLIKTNINLQEFSLINHNSVIDNIKLIEEWKESTKQARVASYISFTGFLARRSDGMIKKAIPSKTNSNKTFFKVSENVKSNAMNQNQWFKFLKELEKINKRDSLIAKLILQGGKRKSEVLNLQIENINWNNNEISFKQLKTQGIEKYTVITYPEHVMIELIEYIDGRDKGLVFITKNGNKVHSTQLNRSFEVAGIRSKLNFKITPHTLRTSTITYLVKQGFNDSEIMKITGHSSPNMIRLYDKSDKANNISKNLSLI
jgi:integrase/recombinase XerD